MSFHVLPYLQLTERGPVTLQAKRWRPVQLTQGSMDGACGPYSVVMALLVLGLMRVEEATGYSFLFDPNQSRSKLWRLLAKKPGLLRDGTDLRELRQYLQHSFGSQLVSDEVAGSSEQVIDFTLNYLRQQQPVLVSVRYAGGAHWLVVVGYEEDAQGTASKLLALDSTAPVSVMCPWNAFLDLKPTKGKQYRYQWANANCTCSVRLEDALSIGRAY